MEKIKSGVIGINTLLDGGINRKSITTVIGAAGSGKTTFATQFLRRGLETGHDGLFISLDENKEQLITEAKEMGWYNIEEYMEAESLIFIDANGKNFSEFVREEMPNFVSEWAGSMTRIVIDPLTPIIWANDDRYTQRELLMLLFKEIKKIGTSICTLEEHGMTGDLSGHETFIPMYLADSVVHLRFVKNNLITQRELEILKCRNSKHSNHSHKFRIIRGFGIIIESSPDTRIKDKKTTRNIPKILKANLEDRLEGIPKAAKERIQKSLARLTDKDFENIDIAYLVDGILEDYSEEESIE
jgi:KaiC/GvpD/RAD55 family RecA-like ATPase